MVAQDYWQLFMETGSPEIYLLYQNARKMEQSHVYYDSGPGPTGHCL